MLAAGFLQAPDAQSSWPRRVCIVSETNPYPRRGGNTEYIDQIAVLLRERGTEISLIVLRVLDRHQLRVHVGALDAYATPFSQMRFHAVRRCGDYFYTVGIGHLSGRLRHAASGWIDRSALRYGWLPPANAASAAWAGRQTSSRAPDVVIANYFNAAKVFDYVPEETVKVILTHDVMAFRAESIRSAGIVSDLRESVTEEEIIAFRSADLCLTIKEEEAAYIRAVAPETRVATIPFACAAPAVETDDPRPPVALFVASDAPPNVDGLGWLLSDVWPQVRAARPDARLRVVGKVADAWGGDWPDGAEKVGFVDDLAAEYAQAALALTPILYGSGVKIKLIEGLAHGLPGVATTVGAEGVAKAPDAVLRVADDARDFAAAILATLDDPDPAATRRAARTFTATHYSRDAVRRALADALASVRPR